MRFLISHTHFKLAALKPENNIHIVTEAFVKLPKHTLGSGNWNNSEYGKELKEKYKHFPSNIHLFDLIYNQRESHPLRGNFLPLYVRP